MTRTAARVGRRAAPRDLSTIVETAERLRVHPDTVRRRIKAGVLRAYSLPGSRRVYLDRAEVDEALVPVVASRPRARS